MIIAIIWVAVILLIQWLAPPKISLIVFIVNIFIPDMVPFIDEGFSALILFNKIAPIIVRELRHGKEKDVAYNSGKRIGLTEASQIYEEKFKKQTEAFLRKEKDWKDDKREYEQLISDMENYIDDLETQANGNNSDIIPFIRMAQNDLRNLKDLAG